MENDRNIDTQTYIYIFERLRDAIERSEFTLYSFGDVSFDCLHFEYLNLTIKNNDTSAKKKKKKEDREENRMNVFHENDVLQIR